jgi:hypothetical protein
MKPRLLLLLALAALVGAMMYGSWRADSVAPQPADVHARATRVLYTGWQQEMRKLHRPISPEDFKANSPVLLESLITMYAYGEAMCKEASLSPTLNSNPTVVHNCSSNRRLLAGIDRSPKSRRRVHHKAAQLEKEALNQ